MQKSITLPNWAFDAVVGRDTQAKVSGATFMLLSDTDQQINQQDHGKSPNFFIDPEDVLFSDEDDKVVVYNHEFYTIDVYDSLSDALAWLPESMEQYMIYELGTDDSLVDALLHCVEYRFLSREGCDCLIARLDAEKHLESESEYA